METSKRRAALQAAKSEVLDRRKAKVVQGLLFYVFIIALFLLFCIFILNFIEITGYASSISAHGGYISEVTLVGSLSVTGWSGVYGLVLTVPGFTQQLSENLTTGVVERADIFFNCIQTESTGGPEIFAATLPNLTFTSSNVRAGTTQMVDNFIGCSNELRCANETFTQNMTIYLGSTNITNIPSTFTFKYDGSNDVFDVGILNVSGNLAFVSHINSTIQQGFNPDVLVNFQMLLPVPPNTSTVYYFYNDPTDVCPSGGLGSSINATVYGYVNDSNGNPIANATVNLAGYSTTSDSTGYYNLSSLVLAGTYNLIAQITGYDVNITNVTIDSVTYNIRRDITLPSETLSTGGSITTRIYGRVNDTSGTALADVNVSIGNTTGITNSTGDYSFYTLVSVGSNPLIGIKLNYNNYYTLLSFNLSTNSLEHNFTMELVNLNTFPTGPFSQEGDDSTPGDSFEDVREQAEEQGQDFWIAPSEINKQVRQSTFIED